MPANETAGAQTRQVWMFMAATAMATTVSTMVATSMVKADATEPAAVTCACEAPAAVPVLVPPPVPAEAPAEAEAPEQAEMPEQPVPSADPERAPTVQQVAPKAEVHGAYDKDLIRRIVRAHISEVRYCYNEGLEKDPELEGRVIVDFVIGSEGKVTRSEARSEMEGDVPECIATAASRWLFPRPADGKDVAVSYPFVLEPG
jgi:hypothetical protein